MSKFSVYKGDKGLVKAWDLDGELTDEKTRNQALQAAQLPFIYKWIALMPDAHVGMGSTVGSVIPLKGAVIPAAVGVDIGCGMRATRVPLEFDTIDERDWAEIRERIEENVPSGRTEPLETDVGSWPADSVPDRVNSAYRGLFKRNNSLQSIYEDIKAKHPKACGKYVKPPEQHLGTLGCGNHFLELVKDNNGHVWIVVHSGSRGTGNSIGRYFTNVAKNECEKWFVELPDENRDLAFLPSDRPLAKDYIQAMNWAQSYAKESRRLMVVAAFDVLLEMYGDKTKEIIPLTTIDCHHNYMSRENHFGNNIWVIRKGAVRARKGDFGIIPGSMGERSFIVEGLGNPDSFHSCSHGAGRVMSRTEARKNITVEEHVEATKGIECIKDDSVIDESPKAYKDIDKVMEAQNDLVKPIYTLKQFICIKGTDKK